MLITVAKQHITDRIKSLLCNTGCLHYILQPLLNALISSMKGHNHTVRPAVTSPFIFAIAGGMEVDMRPVANYARP